MRPAFLIGEYRLNPRDLGFNAHWRLTVVAGPPPGWIED
jgi:hypothetical protein